jgi:hypothetical protein
VVGGLDQTTMKVRSVSTTPTRIAKPIKTFKCICLLRIFHTHNLLCKVTVMLRSYFENRRSQWPKRQKARICSRSLSGIAGSYPAGALLSISCECCVLLQFSATGRSLVQKSPTDCSVSVSAIQCKSKPTYLRWGR